MSLTYISCYLLTIIYYILLLCIFFFFFQAEDGIRDVAVTGVQTCALPIAPPLREAGVGGAAGRDAVLHPGGDVRGDRARDVKGAMIPEAWRGRGGVGVVGVGESGGGAPPGVAPGGGGP